MAISKKPRFQQARELRNWCPYWIICKDTSSQTPGHQANRIISVQQETIYSSRSDYIVSLKSSNVLCKIEKSIRALQSVRYMGGVRYSDCPLMEVSLYKQEELLQIKLWPQCQLFSLGRIMFLHVYRSRRKLPVRVSWGCFSVHIVALSTMPLLCFLLCLVHSGQMG